MRILENCPADGFDGNIFYEQFLKLISYFNPQGRAKVILSTSFWRHEGSKAVKKAAQKLGYKCAEMSDLGDRDDMKAIGMFEHGVWRCTRAISEWKIWRGDFCRWYRTK